MPEDRPTLPPVRLHSEAELARDALATPLLTRAVKLARWAGPDTRVGAGGELAEEQLAAAAAELGLDAEDDGPAYASEAWRTAVDTGLVDVEDPEDDEAEYGTATAGENLALITSGGPQDILAIWLDALEAVHADAIAPLLDDLADAIGDDGEIDYEALDWDPDAEAEFLDGVLGNLYLLTVTDGGAGEEPVPLPALAASMIVPDDMGEPTDDVLEQVSVAMMRLDDQFRLLEPVGLVEYRPVDEALMAEVPDDAEAPSTVDESDVSRYGLVKLTPSVSTASARGCWRAVSTRRPWETSRTRAPTSCSTASRTTPSGPPARRPSSGWPAASPRSPRTNCSARPGASTRARRCAGCTASRRSPWSAHRPSPRCARSSTTPNWAAWRGSGWPSAAPPTCPHRPSR